MIKRYTYKLRPGKQAQEHLHHEYRLARWVWNECVHQQRQGNNPTATQLDKMLTVARRQSPWLRAGSSVVQQQEIRTYAQALNHSHTVAGRRKPRTKTRKKNPYPSLNYTKNGFKIKDNRLVVAGKISLPVVWSRKLPTTPTSVRVFQDAVGDWWASFVVEVDTADNSVNHPQASASAIGIDWGIITTATTTDPSLNLEFRDVTAHHARRLKKYQRRMTLHKKQRDRAEQQAYKRAKKKAARQYRSMSYKRQERGRQWANTVAKTHRYVAVEDFKPKFLGKTTMAKKMHDASIGSFKKYLKEAVEKYNGTHVLVPPTYTSRECSQCDARTKHPLPLQQRIFTCDSCGYTADRDYNAALNMCKRAGFNPTVNDGHQTVSPRA